MVSNNKSLIKSNASDAIPDGGFLQSEHWNKFQKSLGKKTIWVEAGGNHALAVEHRLPLVGSYFFVPRGPILKFPISNFQIPNKSQISNDKLQKFLYSLSEVGRKNNIDWVRVEPQSEKDLEIIEKGLGGKYQIRKSAKDHEPAQTIMVNLQKKQEELLAGMKPKTRYNIRLAEKRGVKIVESETPDCVEKFCDLVEITSKRDRVKSHPRSYYKKMIESVDGSVLKLFLAKYEKDITAGALVSFYGGVATYLHGASSDKHRNVMAPHLLQWEVIKKAQESGCERYDMGGVKIIHSKSNSKLKWDGITRFKTGFCPKCQPLVFPGCWDIILNNFKYQAYRILQQLKI